MGVLKNEKGFTLIELVMVIVILGILAAFALPRFADLQTDARIAALNGLAGSVRAASAIAHSKWLVSGGASITMEGDTIAIVNGYPAAGNDTAQDIAAALVDYTGFTLTEAGATTTRFDKDGAAVPANCSVLYTEAVSPAAPVITVVTGGC